MNSSNSSSNNFTSQSGVRSSRPSYALYGSAGSYASPNNYTEWINYPPPPVPMFPRISSFQPTLQDGISRRAAYEIRRPTEDTVLTGPLGFLGFPVQPESPRQLLVIDRLIGESVPRLLGQSQTSTSTREDSSRLSQDEQNKALKKLRKEVYNPMPKRLSSRLCLYYRDQAANIADEMAKKKEEDGKNCAVCLEDFEPKEMVMMTPCNHMFHEECIVPWVKSHGRCPVCRSAIGDRITGTNDGSFNNNYIPSLAPNSNDLSEDIISVLRAMGAI